MFHLALTRNAFGSYSLTQKTQQPGRPRGSRQQGTWPRPYKRPASPQHPCVCPLTPLKGLPRFRGALRALAAERWQHVGPHLQRPKPTYPTTSLGTAFTSTIAPDTRVVVCGVARSWYLQNFGQRIRQGSIPRNGPEADLHSTNCFCVPIPPEAANHFANPCISVPSGLEILTIVQFSRISGQILGETPLKNPGSVRPKQILTNGRQNHDNPEDRDTGP